ncbi:hypothetical protein, partial [Laspinema olomoucense]
GVSPGGFGVSPGGFGVSPGGFGVSPGGFGVSPGGFGVSPGGDTPPPFDETDIEVSATATSCAAPALTVYGDRLYIAWTGTDESHSLNVSFTSDEVKFEGKFTLPETSFTAPALYGKLTGIN